MKPQATSSASSAQPTLLFIPDISGFTRFVHDTEITHSQHIIEELLEVIIDANEIGLEISEIEGDAILFYREGRAPTAAELLAQIQRMFTQFHAHLKLYETHRICQCGACSSANTLSLKFVIHYGDIAMKQVKEYSKLFGRDVIVAHRLMKNDVPHHEYALFTHQLVNACSSWVEVEQAAWADPEQGENAYDFGAVEYCYITLEPLMDHVPEPTAEDYSLRGEMSDLMGQTAPVDAPFELAFDVLSDLSFRHNWLPGVKDSDELNSKITRVGATHRCVIKGDESDPRFVSHSFLQDRDWITFSETNHQAGFTSVFTLRRIDDERSELTIRYFMKRSIVKELLFKLFMKKKQAENLTEILRLFNAYCTELVREGRRHPAQILLQPAATPEQVAMA